MHIKIYKHSEPKFTLIDGVTRLYKEYGYFRVFTLTIARNLWGFLLVDFQIFVLVKCRSLLSWSSDVCLYNDLWPLFSVIDCSFTHTKYKQILNSSPRSCTAWRRFVGADGHRPRRCHIICLNWNICSGANRY